jgi:hypothetical protein
VIIYLKNAPKACHLVLQEIAKEVLSMQKATKGLRPNQKIDKQAKEKKTA